MYLTLYQKSEFFFGSLKILLILGLIFAGLIVDWGGGPSHEVCPAHSSAPPPLLTRSVVHRRKKLAW